MKAIEMKNIWKKYQVHYEKKLLRGKVLQSLLRNRKYYDEFWALREINVDIEKGDSWGIIGRNASGKSTLLKILSRITIPSRGSIMTNGNVGGLLELGAGFHGDLTGIENIYLNAAILGLSRKEIRKKIDSIISFADIGDFVDTPIKTYSSGMYLRLGFAIAIHADPDILLIDEVLAVGDISFQEKCFEKIREFKKQGKTIILVSHNLNLIEELCDKTILLDDGMILKQGKTQEVVNRYRIIISNINRAALSKKNQEEITALDKAGNKKAEITNVNFLDSKECPKNIFRTGEEMKIRIEYLAYEKILNPIFGLAIYTDDDAHITGPNTGFSGFQIDSIQGKGAIDFIIKDLPLLPRVYKLTVTFHNYERDIMYDCHVKLFRFKVTEGDSKEKYGVVSIPHKWELIGLK